MQFYQFLYFSWQKGIIKYEEKIGLSLNIRFFILFIKSKVLINIIYFQKLLIISNYIINR